ncbi:Kinetochore-associated protein 1 [Bagarius yarrelli]|uniref:Kinetochore-associated protein 1 n=1 Tax=Bagarius yarrelli TaxID=175774 RepID=A0A556V6T5_BAGYA|nr:Kinetochore-associated protein 1 [Bagarius yarrelli]
MWNHVELLINEETNTVRLCGDQEPGNALYQLDTLLKISATEQTLQEPSSNAYESTYKSFILHEVQSCSGLYHLFVIVRYGIYHVSNLALPQTQKAIEDMDFSALNEIQSNIHMDFFSTREICTEGCISGALANFGSKVSLIIGAHGETSISQWCMEPDRRTLKLDNVLNSALMPDVRKIQVVDNLVYVLNKEDLLSLWDNRSLVMLCCWPDLHILDFLLITEGDSTSAGALNRLLYKHKFEEAEKFALAFELDVELVYKVKLDFVMEKLALVSLNDQPHEVGTELVEEAKMNLKKIMDEQYVVQYCLDAFWPTLTTAEEMLNYAANRFPSAHIQSALSKLATFCSLYSSDEFTGLSWIEFLNSRDYLKNIFAFIREGNFSRAQYLWLRHEAEFVEEFNEKSLQTLLSSIPSDIPSQELWMWLKGVMVPFMWSVLPKAQNNWPKNGLMLAELGLPSFWMSTNLAEDCNTEEVEHLKSLVAKLRQLCDLYNKYNCRLSLSDFEMGSTRSMAFLMLDKVLAPELIAGVVESSVRPYALEHRLDLDRILLDYIKLVMDAVLEIMYKAVVPWNDTIERFVQRHLEKDHPKQELLKESYRLMEMKKLLRCYGIRNLTLSNTRETMMLVRHILKQDLSTSLEDSLKLAETYKLNSAEIYYIYHVQLLENNKEDFDIFLTPEEYDDPTVRRQFNQQLITAYENTRAWRHTKKKNPDKVNAKETDSKTKAAVTNDPDGKTRTLSTEAGLHRLARHLERTEQELWADLADRALEAGNVEKALKILSELYQHHPNSSTGRVLFSTARRLCQMLEDNVPMVLPERVNLPALIHKLACQAITICHADLLLDCVELCKSTRDAADVYRQCQIDDYGFVVKDAVNGVEDAYTESSVQEVFNEDGIVLDPVSVLPVQYKITTSLLPIADTDYVRPLLGPMATMLQSLQECSQLELALRLLLESYGSILQHFVSNNMDLSLSMKVHTNSRLVRDKQTLDAIEKTALASINMVVMSLLHKVLNWRVVDCDLAIGLCTVLGKSDVLDILWKIITSAWQNYDKIMAVAMVGAHFCSLYNNQQEKNNFQAVITDAEWGIKLGKFGISIQSVFRQCSETKRNLISTLVKNRNMTAQILQDYCRTYGLDSDSALNLYITTLLLQEKADNEHCKDRAEDLTLTKGDEGVNVEDEDVLACVLRIVPQLSSTEDLVISLHTAFTKLNPYNYERIEKVLKTIQIADEGTTLLPLNQMMGLIQHLKSHKRTSPPTDVENTYLLENTLESSPLANTRLPFHLLLQTNLYFWKIICGYYYKELNLHINAVQYLKWGHVVNLDKLYILTVNHVFKNKLMPLLLDQTKRSQSYGSGSNTHAVIQNIFKHALCIQNPELAAATMHKISQELPAGAEKTMFLKFSLDLVHKLLKSDTLSEDLRTRGELFTSKLLLQYQRSATENALMTFQLDCPELLKLTAQPARLILALFEHNSVVERMKSPAGQSYPDIHMVAKEIASINGVDLHKIRNILLEKWLCKTGQTTCKLLGGSGLRLTFEHRSRALLCLIHIADSATLEALSHSPRDKVKYHLKCYVYLSQLEALNIPYNLERFLSSPKEGMIKGLWKNHSNEPQAVRLVADLCLEYKVYDTQLWSGVLQKLLVFNMLTVITHFSTDSKSLQNLAQCDSSPLHDGCPFLLNLDITGIAKRFAQFNLMAFSLGTLLLLPCTKKREQLIQTLLLSCNPSLILDQVEETMTTGQLAGLPSEIRDCVLTFLSKSGDYQGFIESRHFHPLVKLLVVKVQSDQVQEMVNYLNNHNRKEEAVSLAQEYLRYIELKEGEENTANPVCSDSIKVVFIGMMISSSLWGNISDKYGRKTGLKMSVFWTLFYGILSAFAPIYGWILFLRALVGFGIGGAPQSFSNAFSYYGLVLLTTELFQEGGACGQTNGSKTEPRCSLECKYLNSDDYKDLLWTTLSEFPGLLVTLWAIDRLGRRKTMALCFLVFSICIVPLYACVGRTSLTVLIFIARAFIAGGFQAAYVYTPEVYPTATRALGLGTSSGMARVGALITPFVAQVH